MPRLTPVAFMAVGANTPRAELFDITLRMTLYSEDLQLG